MYFASRAKICFEYSDLGRNSRLVRDFSKIMHEDGEGSQDELVEDEVSLRVSDDCRKQVDSHWMDL